MEEERRLTTEEYLQGEETLRPQELVYGVVRDAPSPLPSHQFAVLRWSRELADHVEKHRLGTVWVSPLDIILDPVRHLVVQPDVFFISNERAGILRDRVRGAPDLVVEVLSPHLRIGKLDERLAWFAEYGVRECWLHHQMTDSVEIVTFADGRIAGRRFFHDEPIESAVLPQFRRTILAIMASYF